MKTILVIESEPSNLVALAMILRCFGYAVLEAGSRDGAWSACHNHRAPIHVVMTKAILDNDSTSEFIARLTLLCPEIRAVLFVSDTPPTKFAGMPREYAFLQTPLCVDVLANTLKALIDPGKVRAASSL